MSDLRRRDWLSNNSFATLVPRRFQDRRTHSPTKSLITTHRSTRLTGPTTNHTLPHLRCLIPLLLHLVPMMSLHSRDLVLKTLFLHIHLLVHHLAAEATHPHQALPPRPHIRTSALLVTWMISMQESLEARCLLYSWERREPSTHKVFQKNATNRCQRRKLAWESAEAASSADSWAAIGRDLSLVIRGLKAKGHSR